MARIEMNEIVLVLITFMFFIYLFIFLGMDEIGIYRLSGIASEIQQLKKLFNERMFVFVFCFCTSESYICEKIFPCHFFNKFFYIYEILFSIHDKDVCYILIHIVIR